MTIKRAVDHFIFKFNNVWKPTETDVKALQTIMDFVEEKHKKQLQDYHLFAKLYIMVYAQYLERYNATVFDDIPKKELHVLLDKPMEYFIKRFTQRLNESELYSLFEELEIELKHPITKSKEQKEKETDSLKNALVEKSNMERFKGEVWEYETVKENLELQINNVINLIGRSI
ncbi:hypothetical protein [Tenacibaculum sp.]|uniref:hypothetical protein n=1 Tax=Tenacibaculum sp. TaxID=1906242 RepID=UPI003D0BC3EB